MFPTAARPAPGAPFRPFLPMALRPREMFGPWPDRNGARTVHPVQCSDRATGRVSAELDRKPWTRIEAGAGAIQSEVLAFRALVGVGVIHRGDVHVH
ncbi:MAG: hypothetical protein EXR47_06770 [Dehalococcoidia bacterium]|nr:hypothetical protein [Dehalococcoidia bacterium]